MFSASISHFCRRRIFRPCVISLIVVGLSFSVGLLAPTATAAPRDKDKPRAGKKNRPADDQPEPIEEEQPSASDGSTAKSKAPATKPTLKEVIAFAKESRDAVKELKDYTARFSKVERIGRNMIRQEMDLKFRTKPFSVYMEYQSDSERGRKALYVDGRNNNQLVVREGKGIASAVAVSLALNDPRIKKENLYPVTTIGIANMLEETIKEWEHDALVEGDEVDVKFYPNAKMNGIPCQAVEVTHLKQLKGIRFSKNRLYIDKATKLPIRGERYGWPARDGDPPPLMEDYKYTNVKTNVNLTDNDFSRARYGL